MCFFFSSRRRHTRYWRDWSSDVCSSDLPLQVLKPLENFGPFEVVTVGERVEPITTDLGMRIVPERTFADVPRPFALVLPRSEERRVGKECRSRWSLYH